MILHHAFRMLPVEALSPQAADFSASEERYLAGVANPGGSRAARRLLKGMAQDWFHAMGKDLQLADIEVLPRDDRNSEAGGPPGLRLPPRVACGAWRVHISLSHSSTHVAALLVVESLVDQE